MDYYKFKFIPVFHIDDTLVLVLGIINLIFPGIGTMIAGCLEKSERSTKLVLIGLGQLLLTIIIFGWVWSFAHGIILIILYAKGELGSNSAAANNERQAKGDYDVKQTKNKDDTVAVAERDTKDSVADRV